MKRLLIALFTLSLLFIPKSSLAASEKINNFDASYQINKDGTVDVTETITYDAGGTAHHGITRNVALTRTNDQGVTSLISVDGISVDAPYTDNSTNTELNLKIGDANTTFTGVKTFVIKYTLSGALTYFTDHDELYWNATGNSWGFPILDTAVSVFLASGGADLPINATCYTGAVGSKNSNCKSTPFADGKATFSTSSISPKEGLSVVFGFPANLVATLEPTPQSSSASSGLSDLLVALAVFAFYFLLPFAVVVGWFLFGRDPKVPAGPTSWFDPPKHQDGRSMLPAEVGLLTDEKVDPRDITATIVSLAIRGWLKIKKAGDDYTFTKTDPKDSKDVLVAFEQTLYDGLFKFGDLATTKTLKTSFPTCVATAQKMLYEQLTIEKYFAHNPNTTRQFFLTLGSLSLFIFNIFLGIVLIIFSRFMPRKTLLGAQKKEEALSLKRFLTSQERQLTFQEQNWYFFEKLLPYAVAFGVTKVWAGRFKDLSVPETTTWYQSDNQLFSAVLFANALDSFSHTASAMTATPYSSSRSSSGFSSGFGGGFSGGGGGGGGGGSW